VSMADVQKDDVTVPLMRKRAALEVEEKPTRVANLRPFIEANEHYLVGKAKKSDTAACLGPQATVALVLFATAAAMLATAMTLRLGYPGYTVTSPIILVTHDPFGSSPFIVSVDPLQPFPTDILVWIALFVQVFGNLSTFILRYCTCRCGCSRSVWDPVTWYAQRTPWIGWGTSLWTFTLVEIALTPYLGVSFVAVFALMAGVSLMNNLLQQGLEYAVTGRNDRTERLFTAFMSFALMGGFYAYLGYNLFKTTWPAFAVAMYSVLVALRGLDYAVILIVWMCEKPSKNPSSPKPTSDYVAWDAILITHSVLSSAVTVVPTILLLWKGAPRPIT